MKYSCKTAKIYYSCAALLRVFILNRIQISRTDFLAFSWGGFRFASPSIHYIAFFCEVVFSSTLHQLIQSGFFFTKASVLGILYCCVPLGIEICLELRFTFLTIVEKILENLF